MAELVVNIEKNLDMLDAIRNDDPEQRAHLTGLLVSLGERAAVYARSEWPDDDLAAL